MDHNKKNKRVRILMLCIIIVCLIPIGQAYYVSVQHKVQQNELKESGQQKVEAMGRQEKAEL